MSNTATDLLPPQHCLTRTEGTHTVISARVATGVVTLFITVFAAFWACVTSVITASVVLQIVRGDPLVVNVNGVARTSSAGEYLLFLSPFVLASLALVGAAIFAHRGRVEARVGHEYIELFTGFWGIGRRKRVARNVVRGISIVSTAMHSNAGRPAKVIRLDGSDVTTGLFLGPAGKAWFAQELRRALNLPPAPPE